MHADREDELHDATGKTVRLTRETRTARDTDNPDRESIVGKDPKSKKHRRSKTPVERISSVEITPKLPKVAPATDVTEEADAAEVKSSKADKKRLRRKAKAMERAEKKKSHQSSDVPHTVITTASPATLIAAKKGTSDQPPAAARVGAAITRFRADDKVNICRENASIFVGLPRGYKSHSSAEALQIAVIQRLKAIRVAAKGVAVTAAKFVWIRLSSTKERDWTLKKFANFKFTLDGVIITPEVVRYGERKEVSKDTCLPNFPSKYDYGGPINRPRQSYYRTRQNDTRLPGLRTSVCGTGDLFTDHRYWTDLLLTLLTESVSSASRSTITFGIVLAHPSRSLRAFLWARHCLNLKKVRPGIQERYGGWRICSCNVSAPNWEVAEERLTTPI